jgi:predicted DNA-binding ribbon-helix-helix protein
MKSGVTKRSIILDGRKTTVSMEDSFWAGLKEIAHVQCVTLSTLIGAINSTHRQSSLASAIRIFVLEHFQNKSKQASPPHFARSTQSNDSRST